jgi:uncharacterized membrane protein YidH (DUF202 family)
MVASFLLVGLGIVIAGVVWMCGANDRSRRWNEKVRGTARRPRSAADFMLAGAVVIFAGMLLVVRALTHLL